MHTAAGTQLRRHDSTGAHLLRWHGLQARLLGLQLLGCRRLGSALPAARHAHQGGDNRIRCGSSQGHCWGNGQEAKLLDTTHTVHPRKRAASNCGATSMHQVALQRRRHDCCTVMRRPGKAVWVRTRAGSAAAGRWGPVGGWTGCPAEQATAMENRRSKLETTRGTAVATHHQANLVTRALRLCWSLK